MARVECEIFDTWTKESKRFSVQPTKEERVKCLAPADISIYCGQDGQAGFINVSNGLGYTQVLKAARPGEEPKPIEDIEPAVITDQEVVTVQSTFHNEILRVRLVNGSENPDPDIPSRRFQPRLV